MKSTDLRIKQSEVVEDLIAEHNKAYRNFIGAYNDAMMALVSVRELEQEIEAEGGIVEKLEPQAGFEF